MSAVQRTGAGQVDVIFDENRCSRAPVRIQAAAAIGEDDGLAAGEVRGSNCVGDGVHTSLFIQMRSAEECQDSCAIRVDAAESSGVTFHCRRSKAREICDRELRGGGAEEFSGGNPTGAEDHSNIVVLDIGDGSKSRRCLLCSIVRRLSRLVAHRGNLLGWVQAACGLGDGSRQTRVDGERLGELINGESVVHGEGDRVDEFACIGCHDHAAGHDV